MIARTLQDRRGATIVEFGLIAPAFCLMLLGAFDVAHTLYMRGALQGVLQKVARDSTLESGSEAQRMAVLDGRVKSHAKALAHNATIDIKRRYYRTFSQAAAARAETWTDTNGNGTCDNGEPYEDANHNNGWDKDGGDAGQGGAKDAVVMTVTVEYPAFFPLRGLLGKSAANTKVVATTILRNQPYGDQSSYAAPVSRNCAA
ncbi:TadE/TadG family type IV pilus assembly protein [Sphingomonas baiyangensis]|uniref:Pilus assembly protein n=1 Tax=Sphingomonas baiyangensis TaxID=2572576 RepID=A0A4U1L1H2_9SPHN|nr:TadE/TadG family type IV pilus assembly protein [Sphingomonas baiyangensis]TKD50697.1 pilus assembly protein [Sphingomonas baiyangensis]